MKITQIFFCLIAFLMIMCPGLSYGLVYFQEDMNQGDLPYSFDYYKFGYSDRPIQTFHDSTGGVSNSGCHRIPLGGPGRTNFDVHFGENVPGLTAYYVRFYLWVNQDFNTDPGENWKLTYNYHENHNFVLWMRPTSDRQGFQPALYSAAHNRDIFKTENVPTLYLRDYKEQWICLEYYVNLATQRGKVWITTENRDYNETLYIDTHFINSGTRVTSIKIGAYWDGTGDSNYFKLDEIVISDQYIGPGTEGGAGGDQVPPNSPTGLEIR